VSEAQAEALARVRASQEHLLGLINTVLAYAKLEAGRVTFDVSPVPASELVASVEALVAPLAAAKGLGYATHVAPSPGGAPLVARADREKAVQVLLNLVANAVKYNREGGDIRVSCTGCDGPVARIAVADSGIGIAPENHGRLFAAFERLGAETTDVEGTGLGLTLSKRLAEAMNGDITVESEVGRGTTFCVRLPVVNAPRARSVTPAATADVAVARTRLPTRTVLYVEDNPSNIRLAEGILANRPEVTLLVATQGGLGLELAREHRPAVVLLDLNLPDMPGEQVLRRLRGDPRTAQTVVVVLSADATASQIARLRRAGADEYLTKPFEIERLLAVIDGATGMAPSPQAEEGPVAPTGPLRADRVEKLRRLYPEQSSLREFVELFLDDVAARIDVLRAAARAGDARAVRQVAHAMRGSCSLAGAHRVEALLARAEAAAKRGEIPDEEQIAGLRAAHEEAARALTHEVG
jgi:CheY-like chemotaxis protein/HPt (histidine-containing phosphotransfer) domain-containing protein